MKTLLHDRSGASVVEFAVLLPLFMSLVIGLMQLGQMLWTQAALQHAVEMAARCASVNAVSCANAGQIQTYAATQAYGLTLPVATFTVTVPVCGNQVAANYAFLFQTILFPAPSINLSARSCYPR
jgi:Flp pilus assembly protein TadG